MTPNTLEEAIDLIIKGNTPETLEYIKSITEEEFIGEAHHSLGRNLRNEWGLWHNENPLCKWFTEQGITVGDDRCGIILDSFHRKICGKDIDLNGQIKHYKNFWVNEGYPDGIYKAK